MRPVTDYPALADRSTGWIDALRAERERVPVRKPGSRGPKPITNGTMVEAEQALADGRRRLFVGIAVPQPGGSIVILVEDPAGAVEMSFLASAVRRTRKRKPRVIELEASS